MDHKLRPVGGFAKCKAKNTRNACHALHELTTSSGPEDRYGKYTQTNTGCPCWFDMTRSDCACCVQSGADEGVQCGAPMQVSGVTNRKIRPNTEHIYFVLKNVLNTVPAAQARTNQNYKTSFS